MRGGLRIFLLVVIASWLASCQDAEVQIPLAPAGLGVTDTEVTFGSSLALQGHAGYLGQETLRGAMSYLQHVNEQGGVHGRAIRVITRDDSYDPPKCLDNTQRFLIEDQVFGLFCYVGTPTAVKILPLVEEAQVPLLGMFTGANALREPFMPYLINVRASYYQETNAAVEHLVQDLKLTRIAVFYQYDAFGFDGLTGTELALKRFGLEPVARGSYVRGTHDISEGLERIRESGAEAVVMIGTSDPCANFIRKSLENEYSPIFYMVSFVGAKELSRNLLQSETNGLDVIMSQVVPPPISRDGTVAESAEEFVRLLEKYFPGEEPNFVGFEGYINAKVLVEGLRRAGRNLSRKSFLEAITSMTNFSLGGDVGLTFGPLDHQGMDKVYFTRLQDGRFILLDDWEQLRREDGQ
ncbi:amino acid/amide ABC transporter substrate-binding protein, HAAT family [Desulfomicrobium apsheronum]|uniref:Amino acid/amide ABC transporter substrate-binding protein, HAAT family n=1 Tax=Desulfomicrobium apsheronum TaxID=52560 RepID=A0A1I3ULY5_9BACT|nr:ABC transporter substrate-binding protein [Desulfomicrobium apsheronum]SFJ83719.1 amino acid/amide ABC transporter substrate-binding protein, HAAT family [Desulfomicrobium apsheronum]